MRSIVRIHSFLIIGLLAAILAQQTSMAQTVNSHDSVLHGRTIKVADEILYKLGPSITQYNQVTNLAQLSGITYLSLYSTRGTFTSLQADDFKGLTNLEWLDISIPYIYAYAYASPVPASGGGIRREYHASLVAPPPLLRTTSHQRFNQGYSTISSI